MPHPDNDDLRLSPTGIGLIVRFEGFEPDWYLEYEGDGPVRVFDPNGFTKAEVEPQGVVPTIRKGDNDVMFFCDQGQDQGQTAKVMFITRGKPLR